MNNLIHFNISIKFRILSGDDESIGIKNELDMSISLMRWYINIGLDKGY